MSINTGEFYAWVSKVESPSGKHSVLWASTSREDKGKERKYSNWMIRCLGESNQKAMDELLPVYIDGDKNDKGYLKDKINIKVTKGSITNEPYENKDGQKVYSNVQVMAWEWEVVTKNGSGEKKSSAKKETAKKGKSPFDAVADEE